MALSLSGTFGTHAGGGPHMTPLNSLLNRVGASEFVDAPLDGR